MQDSEKIKILVNSSENDAPLAIISSPKDGTKFTENNVLFNATLSKDDLTPFDKLLFTWTFDDPDISHRNVSGMAGALFRKNFTSAGPHWAILEVDDSDYP